MSKLWNENEDLVHFLFGYIATVYKWGGDQKVDLAEKLGQSFPVEVTKLAHWLYGYRAGPLSPEPKWLASRQPECIHTEDVIGSHEKYGDLYRCSKCGEYWCWQSARLFDEDSNELVPVSFGKGELGLANLASNRMAKVNFLKLMKVF